MGVCVYTPRLKELNMLKWTETSLALNSMSNFKSLNTKEIKGL